MNLADFLLIAASACHTFVERIDASNQRDRLARLDNLEEILTDLCVRTERRDLEARRLARAVDKLQNRLDTRRADLRGLADRLAALEAAAATATASSALRPSHEPAPRLSPLDDDQALLDALSEALSADVDDDDETPARTATSGKTPKARNATSSESAESHAADAPTSDRAAEDTKRDTMGNFDPVVAGGPARPSSHTDLARNVLRAFKSVVESASPASDVNAPTARTTEIPTPPRGDTPPSVPDRSTDADPPTVSPSSCGPTGDFLFDLFSISRSAIRQAMAIFCAAGIPCEEARVWFASGTWSKPRQPTAVHRKARKLLTEISREYGRHGTAELRRTIDYYTPEATWELFWPAPTNVTPIRRVAEG